MSEKAKKKFDTCSPMINPFYFIHAQLHVKCQENNEPSPEHKTDHATQTTDRNHRWTTDKGDY